MREIKFRAWNSKHKYMCAATYGDWISFDGVPYTEADKKYDTPNIEIQKEKNYILMQFTGLHDKNGKEIFENDIVRLVEADRLYTVEFNDCGFKLFHADPALNKMRWGGLDRIDEMLWHVEVMGNIFSNPELLEKKEKQ